MGWELVFMGRLCFGIPLQQATICCYGRFLELLELWELWELSVINQIMREYLHAKDYLRVDEWCFHFYCHLLYPVYANGTFGCFINGYVFCFLLYGGDGLESAKILSFYVYDDGLEGGYGKD